MKYVGKSFFLQISVYILPTIKTEIRLTFFERPHFKIIFTQFLLLGIVAFRVHGTQTWLWNLGSAKMS